MTYTDSGLPSRTDALEVVKNSNLQGKTYVVTGGSSGIGVETCRALSAAGATVILATRNEEKSRTVIADIEASHEEAGRSDKAGPVKFYSLDLSSLESCISAGEAIAKDVPTLAGLVNNAGVMAIPERRLTKDGFEMTLGVCHFGHMAFCDRLFPSLKEYSRLGGGKARLIMVSSCAHHNGAPSFDNWNFDIPGSYQKWASYGAAKTANIWFAVHADAHLNHEVDTFALHPGGIITGLQREMTQEEFKAMGWLKEDGTPLDQFKSISEGASTSVWAAVAPELEGKGPIYLEDLMEARPYDAAKRYVGVKEYALDTEKAEKFWKLSVEAITKSGFTLKNC